MMKKEIRNNQDAEFRVLDKSRIIEGYALLFNTLSQDLGGFYEKIEPKALDGVIERSDILALFNHISDKVLARNTGGVGTLGLNIDEKGLKYSFSAPKTPLGDEVLDAIQRGDLRNSSFAFTIEDDGAKWEKRGDQYIRNITQFEKLYDVSPVFRPAYLETSVDSRSLDEVKKELDDEMVKERIEPIEDEPITEEPVEEPVEEPKMITIIYEGNEYIVPFDLLKDIIEKTDDERKLDKYLNDLNNSIIELKK